MDRSSDITMFHGEDCSRQSGFQVALWILEHLKFLGLLMVFSPLGNVGVIRIFGQGPEVMQ